MQALAYNRLALASLLSTIIGLQVLYSTNIKKGVTKMAQVLKITNIEELKPTNSQKSFYGKAVILYLDNGGRILKSYNTLVIYENPNGEMFDLWGGYSVTTQKHIKSFCGLNKAQVVELPFLSAAFTSVEIELKGVL